MKSSFNFDNILFVGPDYVNHRGGIGAVIDVYQKNIDNFNFVATYNGNISSFKNLLFFLKSFLKIIKFLFIKDTIEVVHCHSASRGSFFRKTIVFVLCKYIFKKKFLFHIHGAEFHIFFSNSCKLSKRLIRFVIDSSDCVLVLSDYWLRFVCENFNQKNVYVLNNPIKSDILSLQIDEENSLITKLLFLGRIGHRKGIFDLLDILTENADKYRDKLKLRVGGDGDVDKLLTYINHNKIDDMVDYIGWVDNSAKDYELACCDIFVLPSYNEGLPMSILEAMSFQKTIISTNIGGIPEIVIDSINGFLVEPGDKILLKSKIDLLIDDKSLQKTMGEKSLYILEPFKINNVLKTLQSYYKKI